jgi:hypothetical protein
MRQRDITNMSRTHLLALLRAERHIVERELRLQHVARAEAQREIDRLERRLYQIDQGEGLLI